MVLTLIVVPVVYYVFDRLGAKRREHHRKGLIKKVKKRQLETSIV